MPKPKIIKNKLVEITYEIYDKKDNSLLEKMDLPINYIHKLENNMYPKIENALEGCSPGDKVSVDLSPDEGFGYHDPSLTFTDDINNVPEELCKIGAEVKMQNEEGHQKTFIVSSITDNRITVDGNHPFAGKTLRFDLEVKNIRSASSDELTGKISTGYARGLPLSNDKNPDLH
ncbi:MAG: peptidylprolyl isomerase [Gammaproteobacteria bacterium]|nr:MAG: peptidylprolyl isomerase [Gammaproteobacteria bacterium]